MSTLRDRNFITATKSAKDFDESSSQAYSATRLYQCATIGELKQKCSSLPRINCFLWIQYKEQLFIRSCAKLRHCMRTSKVVITALWATQCNTQTSVVFIAAWCIHWRQYIHLSWWDS